MARSLQDVQGLGTFVTAVTLLYFSGQIQCTLGYSTDLLKNGLPGQPSAVQFAQYAGYVRLPGTQKYFYYIFVEAEKSPEKRPLMLWLNGGPGCSSIGAGFFAENGPWRLRDSRGENLTQNPYSWNKAANMLYVESPAGVGFSYSKKTDDYSTDDSKTSVDNYLFLYGWFKKFPSYKNRTLYLSGESYAGHYVPQLAKQVLNRNKYPTKYTYKMKMNLKGVIVGNPYMHNDNDYLGFEFAIKSFFQSPYVDYSFDPYNVFAPVCTYSTFQFSAKRGENPTLYYEKFYDSLKNKLIEQGKIKNASQKTETVKVVKGSAVPFTFSKPFSLSNPACRDYWISSYLNTESVQKAIHAVFTSSWTACNSYPLSYTRNVYSTVPLLKELISAKLRVWLYGGDMDLIVPFYGTRTNIESLKLTMTAYDYQPWYYYDQPAGWVGTYKGLTALTVRGAGHFVPYDQPEVSLFMLQRFLAGRSLPTTQFM